MAAPLHSPYKEFAEACAALTQAGEPGADPGEAQVVQPFLGAAEGGAWAPGSTLYIRKLYKSYSSWAGRGQMCRLRDPSPESQNLHFNKLPRRFICTYFLSSRTVE